MGGGQARASTVTVMSRRDVLLLRAASLWTLFVWAVFVRNLLKDSDRPVGFKVVHLTLAVISVAFAVGMWLVASKAARNARAREEVASGRRSF